MQVYVFVRAGSECILLCLFCMSTGSSGQVLLGLFSLRACSCFGLRFKGG